MFQNFPPTRERLTAIAASMTADTATPTAPALVDANPREAMVRAIWGEHQEGYTFDQAQQFSRCPAHTSHMLATYLVREVYAAADRALALAAPPAPVVLVEGEEHATALSLLERAMEHIPAGSEWVRDYLHFCGGHYLLTESGWEPAHAVDPDAEVYDEVSPGDTRAHPKPAAAVLAEGARISDEANVLADSIGVVRDAITDAEERGYARRQAEIVAALDEAGGRPPVDRTYCDAFRMGLCDGEQIGGEGTCVCKDASGETLRDKVERSLDAAMDNAGVYDYEIRAAIRACAPELIDDFRSFAPAAPSLPMGESVSTHEAARAHVLLDRFKHFHGFGVSREAPSGHGNDLVSRVHWALADAVHALNAAREGRTPVGPIPNNVG